MSDSVELARQSTWRTRLDLVSTLAIIAACAVLVWRQFPPSAPGLQQQVLRVPREPISLEGSVRAGSADAKIVIVEIGRAHV